MQDYRLLDSRVSSFEESLKQLNLKNAMMEKNCRQMKGKEEFLESIIQNLSIKIEEITKIKNDGFRSSLNDISGFQCSNYKIIGHKQNAQISNAQYSYFLQLLDSLQSATISNLQRLQQKISSSYESTQSKCQKMELKMISIWKQSESMIQSLTFQLQSIELKTRTIQQNFGRDKQIIERNFNTLDYEFKKEIKQTQIRLIQRFSDFQSQVFEKITQIQKDKEKINFNEELEKIKEEIQTNLKRNNESLKKQISQKIGKQTQQIEKQVETVNEDLQKKVSQLEIQMKKMSQQLSDLFNQLSSNSQGEQIQRKNTWGENHIIPQSKPLPRLHQNSQMNSDRWSSKSIQNFSKRQEMFKKQEGERNSNLSNKFESMRNQSKQSQRFNLKLQDPKNLRQSKKQKQQSLERNTIEQFQGEKFVGGGIAGLRSLRKKQQSKKSLLSGNNKLLYEESKSFESNKFSRPGGLNPLHSLPSPSKDKSKKSLPPLSSQKSLSRRPQLQRQPGISKYQNYSQNVENESDGEEQYFIDEEGFLIDKDGNRLINENGEEIQLSNEDLERLNQLNQQQNEDEEQ